MVRRCGCCHVRRSGLAARVGSLVLGATHMLLFPGDNNVLCLQTARYLVKSLASLADGASKLGDMLAYLEKVRWRSWFAAPGSLTNDGAV